MLTYFEPENLLYSIHPIFKPGWNCVAPPHGLFSAAIRRERSQLSIPSIPSISLCHSMVLTYWEKWNMATLLQCDGVDAKIPRKWKHKSADFAKKNIKNTKVRSICKSINDQPAF